MDYTKSPLSFRLRKVLRYIRMYGPSRTLVKVRGQYHMQAKFDPLPDSAAVNAGSDPSRHIGLIGCGNFAFSNIAYYLKKNHGRCIRGVMDVDAHRAASLFERYGADYHTQAAGRVLEDPAIDLVYIASNHASHAEYAIDALRAGKAVHIEKPHVVSHEQLTRLEAAAREHKGRIRLGFNRPLSPIGQKIRAALDGQEGASMLNWFVAGHAIDPEHWYFDDAEGGRILGNLCHWTDFVLHLIPESERFPIRILPTRAAASDCDIAVSFVFGQGSIAMITFSAKGHTFEGVRESFSAHKGDVLIAMKDFHDLTIETVEKRERHRTLFREHGHEASILASYAMSANGGGAPGKSLDYLRLTAQLFLGTRAALEEEREVTIEQQPSA